MELKNARATLELTQSELAEALGVDPMTVSRWERGTIEIPKLVELAVKYLVIKKPDDKESMEF